jgi:hypothetical protein
MSFDEWFQKTAGSLPHDWQRELALDATCAGRTVGIRDVRPSAFPCVRGQWRINLVDLDRWLDAQPRGGGDRGH